MSDRDKDAVAAELPHGTAAQIAQPDPGDHGWFGHAKNVVNDTVPDDLDLRVAKQPVLQDLLRPQGIAPMNERHPSGVVGQIDRLLDGGVAAPDDHDILAAKEKPVAGRASRNAKASEDFLARQAEPARLGAGGDDHRIADVEIPESPVSDKRPLPEIDRDDKIDDDPCPDVLGLLPHLLHQPRALDDLGKAGIVLDVGGDGHLPARLQPGDEERLQVGARRVNRRGIARRVPSR